MAKIYQITIENVTKALKSLVIQKTPNIELQCRYFELWILNKNMKYANKNSLSTFFVFLFVWQCFTACFDSFQVSSWFLWIYLTKGSSWAFEWIFEKGTILFILKIMNWKQETSLVLRDTAATKCLRDQTYLHKPI